MMVCSCIVMVHWGMLIVPKTIQIGTFGNGTWPGQNVTVSQDPTHRKFYTVKLQLDVKLKLGSRVSG